MTQPGVTAHEHHHHQHTQQPEVARNRRPMPSDTVSRVLALRRVKSAKDAATTLGLPIGTVKAICSRAGLTRSNPRLREFFQLPEPRPTFTWAFFIPQPKPQFNYETRNLPH